jgi:hypothetical protein
MGMNVSPELALEFLRVFARCEYALKNTSGFCLGTEGQKASADWDAFANAVADDLFRHPNVGRGIRYLLLEQPPMKQVVRGGVAKFEPAPWGSANPGSRLLESTRRVRNNLFHGGKESGERRRGHDQQLVDASLVVLRVAVDCHPDVATQFYQL